MKTLYYFCTVALFLVPQLGFACSMDNSCGPGVSKAACHDQVVSVRKREYKAAPVDKYSTAIAEPSKANTADRKSAAETKPASKNDDFFSSVGR